MNLGDFLSRIEGVPCSTAAAELKRKSKDFFWFSPILSEQLKNCEADVVVCPRTVDEVIRVAAASAATGVPLTPRVTRAPARRRAPGPGGIRPGRSRCPAGGILVAAGSFIRMADAHPPPVPRGRGRTGVTVLIRRGGGMSVPAVGRRPASR